MTLNESRSFLVTSSKDFIYWSVHFSNISNHITYSWIRPKRFEHLLGNFWGYRCVKVTQHFGEDSTWVPFLFPSSQLLFYSLTYRTTVMTSGTIFCFKIQFKKSNLTSLVVVSSCLTKVGENSIRFKRTYFVKEQWQRFWRKESKYKTCHERSMSVDGSWHSSHFDLIPFLRLLLQISWRRKMWELQQTS